MEDTLELVKCFNRETNSCPLIIGCKLNQLLTSIMTELMAEMDQVTIEDIIANQKQLMTLLNR